MSTEATLVIVSTSSSETEQIGEQIGRNLQGGETIELISDLGGGKTTFVRGLAKGMGSTDNVASPTFTLVREYRSEKLVLYHFDFYRVSEAGLVAHELQEIVANPDGVVVVEWAGVVENTLPQNRMKIQITPTGESERRLKLTLTGELKYLLKGLN